MRLMPVMFSIMSNKNQPPMMIAMPMTAPVIVF